MNFGSTLIKTLSGLIILVSGSSAISQQTKPGVLWRISGHGLQHPSYLFGTVHLTDKRLFNFGDSLYSALENVAGYAMEVDPDSVMVYYFNKKSKQRPSPLLKDVISKEKFMEAKKKLQREFGKPAEKVTTQDLRTYYNQLMFMPSKEGKMQTFMDAYLYNIVRKQGKWVGGIEDIGDQTSLIDDFENDEQTVNFYLADFMNDSKQSKRFLEQMIKSYTEGDLDAIRKLSERGSEFMKEFVLIRRNVKMARRIDSLANTRNTFFAIGSAHLPGDSGVINLLREKGYVMTPVLSSQLINVEQYSFQEHKLPWVKVSSSTGLYTAEMPGLPQDNLLDQDNVDLRVYADLGTNLYYFTMGVIGKSVTKLDSVLRALVKNIDKKALVSDIKEIQQDGIDGLEGSAKGETLMYRIRVFSKGNALYLAMVGTVNGGSILHEDANRFFGSFSMHAPPVEIAHRPNTLVKPDLGFSLYFPVHPTLRKTPEEDPNWKTKHYMGIDIPNDIFYQCIVKDVVKGYYQKDDKSALANYKEQLDQQKFKVISFRDTAFDGYKGVAAEFISEAEGNPYYNKVFDVYRGNRNYLLAITTSKRNENILAIDSFMNSFRLIDIENPKWSYQSSAQVGVRTWAASTIEPYSDEETKSSIPYWVIHDSLAPISFFIRKQGFSKYYWGKDDTSVLRKATRAAMDYSDSLADYKLVWNGKYRAVDATTKLYNTDNIKKLRLVLVGDTVYSIFSIGPKQILRKPDYSRLYDDFTVLNDTATSHLFIKKRDALFEALHSSDSATFQDAKETLSSVPFDAADLPYLHHALLEIYPDSTGYQTVSNVLFDRVSQIQDYTTRAFVSSQYATLAKEKEDLKYEMLYLLAKRKVDSNYLLIKNFLIKGLPTGGNPYRFFGVLYDSMALTKAFYPTMLKYIDDSLAGRSIMRLTRNLIDSGILDKKILIDNKDRLYQYGSKLITKISRGKEFEDWYQASLLIDLFQLMNQPESDAWLRKFMNEKDIHVKYDAAMALLKNQQQVESAVFLQLASNKEKRNELYEELKSQEKLSLFPRQYLDQQHLGESILYQLARGEDEEYEVTNIKFIGERTAIYMGEKRKFYLFKIDLNLDDEKSSHLGVAGAYALNPAQLDTPFNSMGLVYDEEYDARRITEQFQKFIKEQEGYEKIRATYVK